MAFVSLFNVITQDMWPTDPPPSLSWLRGRVPPAARSIDKLQMRMERWARVRGRGKGLHGTVHHQSCAGRGQGREVPWGHPSKPSHYR